MEILTLIIKQQYFNEILSGDKKKETREIRPNTQKKYVHFYDTATGATLQPEDINEDSQNVGAQPRHYDAIRFCVGYAADRPTALVKVEDAKINTVHYEDGEPMTYEEKGKKYVAAQIVYDLGDIIESPNV